VNRTQVFVATGAAVLATLALSACNPAQAGSAAVISDERITVSSLQDTTEDLLSAGGSDQPKGTAQRDTLVRMIRSRVYAEAAAAEGVTVTDRDVQVRKADLAAQVGGADQLQKELVTQFNIAPSYEDQFLRDIVTAEKLGEKLVPGDPSVVQQQRNDELNKLLIETGKGMDIEVNPRFGTWNEDNLQIKGQTSGGLSQTVQELQAAG
jgi:hypothetical protein